MVGQCVHPGKPCVKPESGFFCGGGGGEGGAVAGLPVLLFWFKVLSLFLSNITHGFSVALHCKDLTNTSSVTFAFLAVGLNLLPRISK